MKALSLIQPYATLIMLGYKQFETRSWNTSHCGPLAIHASVGKPKWAREVAETDPHIKAALAEHGLTFDTLPRGAVLGVCKLMSTLPIAGPDTYLKNDEPHMFCHPEQLTPMEFAAGDYTPGRYAWKLEAVEAIVHPIACKGALSLWELPGPVFNTLHIALSV